MRAETEFSAGCNIPIKFKSRYRPEVDGLRAFAVIAVIINHFNKASLPSGYLGVDIFFVISGYVITSSLLGRESQNFGDFLSGFYERRIKRLVPALIVFILITSLAICFVNPEPYSALAVGFKALFGLSNITLYRASTDYFAESTELNPFTHTWSLGVEEQFYLLFPFLIWFTGFGRQTKNGARNLFLWIGALTVASLAGFIVLYNTNQPAAYFLMPTRFWEMAAGCLVFIGFQKRAQIEQTLEQVPPLLVIGAMVGVMFLPITAAVPATLAMVFLATILLACLKRGTAAFAVFTNTRIVFIGLISYSLYLWHWGVLSLSRWTIGIHWWTVPFQAALMLILAISSYQWIEQPMRKLKVSSGRATAIGSGLGSLALASALPFSLSKQTPNHLYAGTRAALIQSGVRSLTTPYRIKGESGRWVGDDCVLSDNKEVGAKINIANCTLGNFKTAQTRVLVIGDSFSSAFVQAFDQLVREDNFAITITSSWGASPAPELPNTSAWSRANNYYWNTLLPSLFNQLRKGDIVFVISDLARFLPAQSSSGVDADAGMISAGIESLAAQLASRGIHLVYLHALPFAREANCTPDAAMPQWYAPFGSKRCSIPGRDESLKRRQALADKLTALTAQQKIDVVDLFDTFCPENNCSYVNTEKTMLYRDEYSHPSVEAVRLSAPIIRSVLLQAGS